jgi:hypothetical protein
MIVKTESQHENLLPAADINFLLKVKDGAKWRKFRIKENEKNCKFFT